MTSKHIVSKLSNIAPAPYASDQKEAPKINIANDGGAPASLSLLYPNPGGIELSDDLWMVDIPDVNHYLNLLQCLTLSDSLVADNLSIEVSIYEDT